VTKGISRRPIPWPALTVTYFLAVVRVPVALAQDPAAQPTREPVAAIAAPAQGYGLVSVLQVRPDVYMLTVGGRNIALQVGRDGGVVVDTGPSDTGQDLVRAIRALTPEPIRYIIDTSADPGSVGGNALVAAAGVQLGASTVGRGVSSTLGFSGGQAAQIIAYQNVINRMLASPPGGVAYSGNALPGEFYDTPEKNFYMNDSAIDVIWEPAAHSDGDSVVVFRRDDVVVTGDIFDMTHFPVIDLVSPDPTGIQTMEEIFQTVPNHGHLCTTGVGFDPQDKLSFPANQWLDGSRQHHSSQFGGTNSLRDIPNYVRLIEAGKYDAKGMITMRYDLHHIMDAYHDVAYRRTLTAVITVA
jgi:glyoxylase-like metal-dependent hydrolase (beta-lactamase superfamily II)